MELEIDLEELVGEYSSFPSMKAWRRAAELEAVLALEDAGLHLSADVGCYLPTGSEPARMVKVYLGCWSSLNYRDIGWTGKTFLAHINYHYRSEKWLMNGRRFALNKARASRLWRCEAGIPSRLP